MFSKHLLLNRSKFPGPFRHPLAVWSGFFLLLSRLVGECFGCYRNSRASISVYEFQNGLVGGMYRCPVEEGEAEGGNFSNEPRFSSRAKPSPVKPMIRALAAHRWIGKARFAVQLGLIGWTGEHFTGLPGRPKQATGDAGVRGFADHGRA